MYARQCTFLLVFVERKQCCHWMSLAVFASCGLCEEEGLLLCMLHRSLHLYVHLTTFKAVLTCTGTPGEDSEEAYLQCWC